MKIDQNMLSIPPYISTRWYNISALYMKGSMLVISLYDGDTVTIPGLTHDTIEKIFETHTAFLESEPEKTTPENGGLFGTNDGSGMFRIAFNSMEGMNSVMQHNPAQADSPDLPAEILNKLTGIIRIAAGEDPNAYPKPEPHCNCIYCQLAKALKGDSGKKNEENDTAEPEIKDDELQFQQWDVHQSGNQLFTVTNRLDKQEHYNVFLGNPVGCTCGKEGCEHIVAVLKS